VCIKPATIAVAGTILRHELLLGLLKGSSSSSSSI
jgi:hypothetical protein